MNSLPLRKRRPQPSLYLNDDYYDALVAWRARAADLQRMSDPLVEAECRALVHEEARLLDSRRYEDWINLWAEECVYWIPADDSADPRRAVNIALDDRRRLEDRVVRLTTGYAHNQEPDRALRHLVTNVEAWEMEGGEERRVMANEMVFEHRVGRPLVQHIGMMDYWLVREDGDWRIKVKRVVLVNRAEGLETPTLL